MDELIVNERLMKENEQLLVSRNDLNIRLHHYNLQAYLNELLWHYMIEAMSEFKLIPKVDPSINEQLPIFKGYYVSNQIHKEGNFGKVT